MKLIKKKNTPVLVGSVEVELLGLGDDRNGRGGGDAGRGVVRGLRGAEDGAGRGQNDESCL